MLSALLVFIGFIYIIDYFIRRKKLVPIIAGDVDTLQNYPDKYLYRLNNFKIDGRTVKSNDFYLVGYLKGNSLAQFGLYDGNIVFCERVDKYSSKKDDILVLKTLTPPNEGKLKARKCLGYWGKENEPDEDLKLYADFDGTVAEYFTEEILNQKKSKPYKGKIEGYLKTISCEKNSDNVKISRPHNPDSIKAKVKYVI